MNRVAVLAAPVEDDRAPLAGGTARATRHRGLLCRGLLGAWLLLSTPAAAQPPEGAPPARDAVGRLLERAALQARAGHDAAAWRILGRAQRRVAAEDGRVALALGRALPTELRGAPEAPWPDRARAAQAALAAFLEASQGHADGPADGAEARRLEAYAAGLGGDLEGGITRASATVGLQDRATAQALRDLATVAVDRAQLALARRALEAAHRAYPQDNALLRDLGVVELALGEPQAAAERFARVLGRQPTDLAARRDLAGALVASGRADGAVELLTQATRAHPDDVELWLELAHAAVEAGAPQTAERAARAAIERAAPSDGRGHAALGAALAAQHLPAGAADAFREALRRDRGEPRARRGLDALGQPPGPAPPGAPAGRREPAPASPSRARDLAAP